MHRSAPQSSPAPSDGSHQGTSRHSWFQSNHSVNKHFLRARPSAGCWAYRSEQNSHGLCLLQKRPPHPTLRLCVSEGRRKCILLSAYYVSDALLVVLLNFADHERPTKRLC